MDEAREKLVDELSKTVMVDIFLSGQVDVEKIADFIIADRKRIVEPLVKFRAKNYGPHVTANAEINETLRNAGLE